MDAVLYGCIDIGSNTTRLLVAEPTDAGLREVMQQRAYTRVGKSLKGGGVIPPAKLAEVVDVVSTQVRLAHELGTETIRVVATAAIRDAANGEDIADGVAAATGLATEILTDEQEARLAFTGATRTLGHPPEGQVAVVDVGGGSSELAVGTAAAGMTWSASMRIGSGMLADAYLQSDPPSIQELHEVREHVAGVFEGLDLPPAELGIAVGGSATSLRRLVGAVIEHDTLERGIRVLASSPIEEVGRRFELDPERVKVLPAGILILEEASDRLGIPLQIGRGGLREGAIFELLEAAS